MHCPRAPRWPVAARPTGAVMPATIVDHVKPGMTIYGDETFGPITTVVRVKGVDEAVAVANDSDYGLSAAVFGRDVTPGTGRGHED
jgi:acyl-CoA reductase-like NAD-dependent aldehyde dehydrogenase